MTGEVAPLLEETIEALSLLDAERLEHLQRKASGLCREECSQEPALQLGALKSTLLDLLRTTDCNLRLLRQLHELRITGLSSDRSMELAGVPRWVR